MLPWQPDDIWSVVLHFTHALEPDVTYSHVGNSWRFAQVGGMRVTYTSKSEISFLGSNKVVVSNVYIHCLVLHYLSAGCHFIHSLPEAAHKMVASRQGQVHD